jgi:hypothetical protein
MEDIRTENKQDETEMKDLSTSNQGAHKCWFPFKIIYEIITECISLMVCIKKSNGFTIENKLSKRSDV